MYVYTNQEQPIYRSHFNQRNPTYTYTIPPPKNNKGAGLTVAVLEELSELDAGPSKGPGRQRLKTRVLAQVGRHFISCIS